MKNNPIYNTIKLKVFNRGSVAIYPIVLKNLMIDKVRTLFLLILVKTIRSRFLVKTIREIDIDKQSILLRLENGTSFFLPTDKIDSLNGLLSGKFEESETSRMIKYIKKGDVVLDIGANYGFYTVLFSKWVGQEGRVHAFEPLPWAITLLEKNLLLNKATENTIVNKFGLGDKKNTAVIYKYAWCDSGWSSMEKHGWIPTSNSRCKIITLDAYVKEKKINKVDFIKCDIEGGELPVFKGARATLAKFSPVIIFEVLKAYEKDFNYKPHELYDYLTSLNYDIYNARGDKLRLIKSNESHSMWGYYLAIPHKHKNTFSKHE
ncbi:MAG: FkbM family methyltransferase [Candidatus Levyibacteriota bacterium]|jgi:FkbM family methyltransferase